MHKPFDARLSLAIDACYVQLEHIQAMRNTPRKIAKLILWRCRLGRLLRAVTV